MIDITIKTLDSRNHSFNVTEELTVKEFKEHIAETVEVPAASQRLIYCGRVLADDKKLSEYSVDGKVIHLVQRAPPRSESETRTSTTNNDEPPEGTRRNGGNAWRIRRQMGRLDGSNGAMYLGAMAFPADLMDAQGITMPQPRYGLSQSRLNIIRTMLQRARTSLQTAENGPNQATETPEPAASPSAETNSETARAPRQPNTQALAELISQVTEINTRAQISLTRYHALLRDDPILTDVEEPQRLFNQVSDFMHSMSHAYHAISDLLCDFNMPPPRMLRCRPVLIQHSAVLQAGIPLSLGNAFSGRDRSSGTSTTEAAVDAEGAAQPSETANPVIEEEIPSLPPNSSNDNAPDPLADSPPTPRTARMRVMPGDIQFIVDVSQSAFDNNSDPSAQDETFGSLVDQVRQASGATGETSASSTDTPAPPRRGEAVRAVREFVHNFTEVLADMSQAIDALNTTLSTNRPNGESASSSTQETETPAQTVDAESTSEASTPVSTNASASTAGTQTGSQVWQSTETWPTTSTQTRSTTRPHVHMAPIGHVTQIFDPFLPCNSHHIRSLRRREQTEQTSQPASSSTASTSSGPSEGSSNSESIDQLAPTLAQLAASLTNASGGSDQPQRSERNQRDPRSELIAHITRMAASDAENAIPPRLFPGQFQQINVLRPLSFSRRRNIRELDGFLRASVSEGSPILFSRRPNILSELILEVARNLRLINYWMPNVTHNLIILRSTLVRFVREEVLHGGSIDSPSSLRQSIERINQQMDSALRIFNNWFSSEYLSNANEREADVVATIHNINQEFLPPLFRAILEEDEAVYCRDVRHHFNNYLQFLTAVVRHMITHEGRILCSTTIPTHVEESMNVLGESIMQTIPPMPGPSRQRIFREMRDFCEGLRPTSRSVEKYIVYKRCETPCSTSTSTANGSEQAAPQASSPPVIPQSKPQRSEQPAVSQAMEIEERAVDAEVVATSEQIADPLPDVIIGAEQWHNHIPPDWVPVLTRDRERQRRQSAQGPLSDAYLSGMPSKRRKVVNSTKPSGNLTRVISESMSTAMSAAGVAPTDEVAEAAGDDPIIRATYKDQVRNVVEARLRNHPDYNPEKYPNAAKLFGPK